MRKKLNAIDIAVVLLVIVAIVGFAVRFKSSATDSVTSDIKFRYTMKIDGIRSFTVDALEKKGIVTDEDSVINVGEITDVVVEDSTKAAVLTDGSMVSAPVPERYTCYVTIEAMGRESEGKYILDDTTELAVGRTTDLVSKFVHTSGTIESIEIIN